MSKKLSDDQVLEVISSYKCGESAKVIGDRYGITPTSVYGLLKRRNIPRRTYSEASRKYSLNESYFDMIDSQNKAYFLGFIMADGYNNEKRNVIEVSTSPIDIEILNKLNKEVNSSKPIRFIESNGIRSCRLDLCSHQLSVSLAALGCGQAKTFTIQFPDIDVDLRRHFIRGYFDGDGCISYSYINKGNMFGNILNGVVTLVGTTSLCTSVKKYIKSNLGINSMIRCRHPEHDNNIRTLQISGNQQVIKFMEFLYKDANLYLSRKRSKFFDFVDAVNKRKTQLQNTRENLVAMRDIVNNKVEYWNAMYLISHGIVESHSRSKLTPDQASILRKKLNNSTESIIPQEVITKEFDIARKNGFPFYKVDKIKFNKGIGSLKKATIEKSNGTYLWGGKLTELATFFHPHIFECKRPNHMSPIELFNDDVIFRSAITKLVALYPKILPSNVREICRNDSRSSRINNFPPRVVLAILQELCEERGLLSPLTVLDPCAGFSGRLIGCACSKKVEKYVGIDVSQETCNGLNATKDWLCDISDMDTNIVCDDCLLAMRRYVNVDLILTSPPFLDMERYKGVKYATDYKEWTESFVIPFIKNSYMSLRNGGIMAIYLEKIRRKNFPGDFSSLCAETGFLLCEPIPFRVSYGENNRGSASNRTTNILIFKKPL